MSVTTFAAAQILRVIPRVRLSQAVGRLCERPLPPRVSRAVASAYSKAYRVNLDEAEPRSGAYRSFDEFFTRRLRVGARVVSDDDVVSPADGRLESTGPVDRRAGILVKGKSYDVAELIGDDEDARRYAGGCFAVVYLSPRDYHRVHSPVSGRLASVRSIPGDLYPVNSIGERHIPKLFATNLRVSFVIDSDAVGRVTLVMVGAVIVGRITVTALPGGDPGVGLHRLDPAVPVDRGDEIGIFHLGSTVVLFLEQGAKISRDTGPIRYGESLLAAS